MVVDTALGLDVETGTGEDSRNNRIFKKLYQLLSLQNTVTNLYSSNEKRWAHATFIGSTITIPQLEESTSAIAIPQLFKEMWFCNRNSVIAVFSEIRNF
jgi:hypothetical protein